MDFDPETVSQLHADVVFLLVGLTVALLVALYAVDSPGRLRRAARDLLIVQLAQGVVGFVQYFTDLPIAARAAAHARRRADRRVHRAAGLGGPRPGVRLPLDAPRRAGHRHPLTGGRPRPCGSRVADEDHGDRAVR